MQPSTNRIRRILVIEDDDGVRAVLCRHLRRRGFEVDELADADSVLLATQQKQRAYDLVLADVHLGGVFSGVELMEILMAQAPLRPVVIITGDRNSGLARTALRKGAAGYLLKPFELFELDAVLRELFFRVELLEATRDAEPDARRRHHGGLPAPWLRLTDERSGAGPGHTFRVAQIANLLASHLPGALSVRDRQVLDVAARAHELGRVAATIGSHEALETAPPAYGAEPAATASLALAVRTAQLLADLGLDDKVVATARSLFERWDGGGGPDGLVGEQIPIAAQVLSVADALDHGAVAAARQLALGDAVRSAVDAVLQASGIVFSPTVTHALEDARSVIESLWVLQHAADADPKRPATEPDVVIEPRSRPPLRLA
ncbi:MAG: response regulator [Longimicrobiales bacterium]